jgi:glycosyltransferase involved in cell wall biosynthesis
MRVEEMSAGPVARRAEGGYKSRRMVRVMHLVGGGADFQTTRALEALTRSLGDGFDVTAERAGGVAREALRGRRRERSDATIVHAWGGAALAAAVLRGRGRIVFSPTEFPSRRALRWLRAAMAYRDIHVVCPAATQRRAMVEGGVPLERCHLVRPGVDFSRVRRRRDPALRKRLGFSDGDYVLLAPGESTRAAAHEDAAWAAAIAHYLEPTFRMLVWGRGGRAGAVMRRGRAVAEGMLRRAEPGLGQVEFEALLPAADAVLVAARGPVPTLPIAVCMAAGLPIVSAVTYTVAELLEDRHTALMVPRHEPRLMARRLLDLRADASLQWRITDVARTEAYEYFSLTRFVEQWRGVYRQVAGGGRVDVAEPPPGAGRRFHGRV